MLRADQQQFTLNLPLNNQHTHFSNRGHRNPPTLTQGSLWDTVKELITKYTRDSCRAIITFVKPDNELLGQMPEETCSLLQQ